MASPGLVLSSLTTRGRCLVGAGGALLLLGVLLGEQALVQLAVFVLALPVISALTVARERFRLASRRTLTPARLPRGDSAERAARGEQRRHPPRRALGPHRAGAGGPGPLPRFVVDRLPGRGDDDARATACTATRRGRHALGPLRLRLVDPFGLVERSAVGTDTATLLVVPRVRPLGAEGPAGGHGGGGEGSRRTIAVHGEDDVSTRRVPARRRPAEGALAGDRADRAS